MLANPRVEGRHRLIEQQQRRRWRQGASQRHPLLLAAGKLAGILLLAAAQAHQLEHLRHPLAHFVATAAGQAVGDVGFDGKVGEQRVGLEQNAVIAGLRWQLGDVAVADVQGAAVLALEAGDATQQGGLAAAGGAKQAHQFTGSDVEGNIVQGGKGAEALVDTAHFHLCAWVCDRSVHGRTSSNE
ncbi:hypothetical protein D3C80_1178540 [compost metagenome]